MATAEKHMTPLKLIRAIERLSDDEKETLAILADKKLAEELFKRRKDALIQMKKGELITEKGLFEKG